MSPAKSFRLLSISAIVGLFGALSCESDDDEAPKWLSEACDTCLSREECSVPWAGCKADADCTQYVQCVLRVDCYTQETGSGCEERAGCEFETDAEQSRRAYDDFEVCARTECAGVCGFVAP